MCLGPDGQVTPLCTPGQDASIAGECLGAILSLERHDSWGAANGGTSSSVDGLRAKLNPTWMHELALDAPRGGCNWYPRSPESRLEAILPWGIWGFDPKLIPCDMLTPVSR